MKPRWLITTAIGLTAFAAGGWFSPAVPNPESERLREARLFERVLDLVRDHYVDSIAEPELYRQAAYGLVSQLEDPYSALLMGDDFRRSDERTTGDYGGIGARIDIRNRWITVVSTLPDTPAERAGIMTGDVIVAVAGNSTRGWTVEQAVATLRGKVGTEVVVRIARDGGDEPMDLTLRRARVHQRAVARGIRLVGDVGYLSMEMVRTNSASELASEVGRLYAAGVRGLIIDLRGNPGGLRDESVAAADLFLDPGATILVTRGRTVEDNLDLVDSLPQPWPDMRTVVLVNGGTASASEIIAGALQDNDRALIVGRPTFGKGLVQTQFWLARDVALRITTARWFTPSGRSIQRESVDIPHGHMADSAGVPAFHTVAGRPLDGGGGIVPDLVMPRDTLTDRERALAKALDGHLSEYRDALANTALSARRSGLVTSAEFAVSETMVNELASRLAKRGVVVDSSVWLGGRTLVDSHLTYEIARYVFGDSVEMRRRLEDDAQVHRAVELLQESGTPEDLFKVAGSPLPTEDQG